MQQLCSRGHRGCSYHPERSVKASPPKAITADFMAFAEDEVTYEVTQTVESKWLHMWHAALEKMNFGINFEVQKPVASLRDGTTQQRGRPKSEEKEQSKAIPLKSIEHEWTSEWTSEWTIMNPYESTKRGWRERAFTFQHSILWQVVCPTTGTCKRLPCWKWQRACHVYGNSWNQFNKFQQEGLKATVAATSWQVHWPHLYSWAAARTHFECVRPFSFVQGLHQGLHQGVLQVHQEVLRIKTWRYSA